MSYRTGIMIFIGRDPIMRPQVSGHMAHLAESVPMIEYAAYENLKSIIDCYEKALNYYRRQGNFKAYDAFENIDDYGRVAHEAFSEALKIKMGK